MVPEFDNTGISKSANGIDNNHVTKSDIILKQIVKNIKHKLGLNFWIHIEIN